MPELPEVETITNAIAKAIGASNIISVSINNNKLREKIPDDFAQKVKGAAIVKYQRIAKYITIELDNGLTLIWHMGMSGKVKISDKRPEALEKHDHVVIETTGGCLVYNDTRRFGILTYCPTADLENYPAFAKTGLDPFDEKLDGKYLLGKLAKKRIQIKLALLDQSIINGIGNIYDSEILYMSRISPFREACSISLKEAAEIIKNTRIVLKKAIAAGGSTIHDYKKPDGSLGYFQNEHCVYNKTGQRCPDCKCNPAKTGGIQKTVQGGRSTFYCPTLQKQEK